MANVAHEPVKRAPSRIRERADEATRHLVRLGVLSDEQIAKATDLTLAEIQSLRIEDKHSIPLFFSTPPHARKRSIPIWWLPLLFLPAFLFLPDYSLPNSHVDVSYHALGQHLVNQPVSQEARGP